MTHRHEYPGYGTAGRHRSTPSKIPPHLGGRAPVCPMIRPTPNDGVTRHAHIPPQRAVASITGNPLGSPGTSRIEDALLDLEVYTFRNLSDTYQFTQG